MEDLVLRCLAVDTGSVAQATFAAILAVVHCKAPGKLPATLVAAATRRANCAQACGSTPEPDSLAALQVAFATLGVSSASAALGLLRQHGRPDLARRVGRLSKTRNGQAHLDTALLDDLRHFVAVGPAASDQDRGRAMGPGMQGTAGVFRILLKPATSSLSTSGAEDTGNDGVLSSAGGKDIASDGSVSISGVDDTGSDGMLPSAGVMDFTSDGPSPPRAWRNPAVTACSPLRA